MPESPRWLLRQGKYEKARHALGLLGLDVTTEQIEQTADELAERDRRMERRSNWTPGVRRALLIVVVFFIFQQITGINIPLYYGPHLLAPLIGGGGGAVHSAIAAVEVTTLITVVNVAATYLGFRYIDRLGRRALSISGYTGMAVFMLVSAAGLAFFTGTTRIVVVMIGLCLFIASFAMGVGGTGWLLQGEVFPTSVRGRAAAIGATADWLANFVIIEIFPSWQSGWGLAWVMVSFAVLALLAILFIAVFLPETKGLSVEDIIDTFEKKAAAGTTS
jgi:MFS family permease